MLDHNIKAVITAKYVHVWTAFFTTECFPGCIGATVAPCVRGQAGSGRVFVDAGHELNYSRPHIGLESVFVVVPLFVSRLGKVLHKSDIKFIDSGIIHQ